MKIHRLVICCIFLLLLTSCGHLSKENQQQGSSTSVTILPSTSTHSESTPAPSNSEYNNLLDELRAGFSLPEYSSKDTKQFSKWSTKHPRYLNNLFKDAEPFLYYIVQELKKRNMPLDLALLPAVESAYKPNAISSSKAAGIWQFIPSTGKHFNLRQDWWFDGRRDLILSTNAALDYLQQYHKRFNGDWFLAIAAYNAGGGTISNAIAKNKRKGLSTNFNDLSLRAETRRYIPKLIALRNIIRNPKKYGIKLPVINNQAFFSVLPFKNQINISQLASQSKTNIELLQHLNSGFLRWATPPNGPHRLLVPQQNVTAIKTALNSTSKTSFISSKNHRVQQGESLSQIANKYGVTVTVLRNHNKLNGNLIRAGQVLIIPMQQLANAKKTHTNSSNLIHRVKQGDSLWSIANRYQVSLAQLLSLNKLNQQSVLNLGQLIKVPR